MKIVILGAGQVGSTLAESLVSEQNDITLVDHKPEPLRDLQDKLDLRTVVGSAAHPSTLVDAGIEDADMVIAVTQSDETNLVACKVAANLFNTPTRIARVRSRSILERPELLGDEGFAVDYAISPEDIVTEYITRLIEFPEALQVLRFAGGRVTMVAVRAVEGGPLVGHPLTGPAPTLVIGRCPGHRDLPRRPGDHPRRRHGSARRRRGVLHRR